MECTLQARAGRLLWSCYLVQSYSDEQVAWADMWVPINLAKASSLCTSPNVISTLKSLGRVGQAKAAAPWTPLLECFPASLRGGQEGGRRISSSQATSDLALLDGAHLAARSGASSWQGQEQNKAWRSPSF